MAFYRYRDKKGRWSKFDKRKKLVQYLIHDRGYIINKSKLVSGRNLINKVPKVYSDPVGDLKRFAKGLMLEPQEHRYFKTITLFKNDNTDIHKFLATNGINKLVAGMSKSKKGIIVARVTVRMEDDKLISREIPVTSAIKIFTEQAKKGRRGKKYSPANLLAYAIHDSMNQQRYSPYYRKSSGGNPLTNIERDLEDGYDWTRQQSFTISFRSVSKKSTRSLFKYQSNEPM
jgi:hypothetical protein